MCKKIGFLVLIIFIISPIVSPDEGKPLHIKASVKPRSLSRGEEGKVVLNLKVEEGINISPQPFFIVEIGDSEELTFPKDFFTASDLEMEIIENKGKEYLDLEEPLEIPFTVKLATERGWHTLEGKVKYFACSNQEGWCLKTASKFKVSFYTRSTNVKK